MRPDVINGSFKQEEFTTDSGLKGMHVSYDLKLKAGGRSIPARNHIYIVNNRKGACVGIGYTTLVEKDTEGVHQMIRQTLRLQ